MTVRITRDDRTASELRKQAGRVKDGRVSRRLLAIALVMEGASRKRAAERKWPSWQDDMVTGGF